MKRLLLLICLSNPSTVLAVDSITLQLGAITGTGWQTDGVVAQLHWLSDNQISLTLKMATLTLPDLKKPLKNLSLSCPRTDYSLEKIACSDAKLHIGSDLLDKPHIHLSFSYVLHSQRLRFQISEFAIAGGDISFQASSAPDGWYAQLNIGQINLEKLLSQLGTLIEIPTDFSLGGATDLKITATGDTEVRRVFLEGKLGSMRFSNADGTQAGENIAVKISLKAIKQRMVGLNEIEPIENQFHLAANRVNTENGFKVQGKLTVNRGELLIEPAYLAITEAEPITMMVNLSWQPQRLNVQRLIISHGDILTLQGTGHFTMGDEWAIETLSVESHRTSLKKLYTHYLRAMLNDDSEKSGFDMDGLIKVALDWNNDDIHAIAWLKDIDIEDTQKTFGLKQLRGQIQWHNNATQLPSHIIWSNAYVAKGIELGSSQIRANLSGNNIELLAPWYQPILDGALRIEQFDLKNLGQDDMSFQLHGRLYSISLSELSAALDIPPLNGKISGQIPSVRYNNKLLEMGGELRMRVFDGDIVVNRLKLTEPFGRIPVLETDIELTRINLKTLTAITEFGHIQGQLSGYVRDLHLVNWQPIAFKAHFMTPEDDPLPHQISQQAIRNLSSLGGNAAVDALSRGVLRFFENFSYDRIGWGCILQNNICQMSGAGPAPRGYYIIKGGGLPRIDIIGYNQSVDWNELISRLKRVTNLSEVTGEVGGPVIK
jgi:hypothetical protein